MSIYTCTLARILLSHGKHVATVTAPIGAQVCGGFKSVGNAMVEFFLFRVRFGIRFRYALGNHFLVALFVASIFAVRALHASGILEKFAAERAPHDVVKLLLHELVAIHLVDFFLLCSNSTFSPQRTKIWLSLSSIVLCYSVFLFLARVPPRGLRGIIRTYRNLVTDEFAQRVPEQTTHPRWSCYCSVLADPAAQQPAPKCRPYTSQGDRMRRRQLKV